MARMDDQLRACRVLWRDAPASFESATVRFEGIWSNPKPLQSPLPLWFGLAPTEANAQRIAELGEGWIPIYPDPAFIREGTDLVRRAFEMARRDPGELRVRAHTPVSYDAKGVGDLGAALAAMHATRAAGARGRHRHRVQGGHPRAPRRTAPRLSRADRQAVGGVSPLGISQVRPPRALTRSRPAAPAAGRPACCPSIARKRGGMRSRRRSPAGTRYPRACGPGRRAARRRARGGRGGGSRDSWSGVRAAVGGGSGCSCRGHGRARPWSAAGSRTGCRSPAAPFLRGLPPPADRRLWRADARPGTATDLR